MQGLEGIRVLELGGGVAAGYTTKLLADLGAEVVKVEPSDGDPVRHRGPWRPGDEGNPTTGDHAMPTMGTFIQLLPKGFKTAPYRATDATVFCAAEGKGRTRIGTTVFEWQAKDIFVAPSWHWTEHEALDGEAVLFSFSDRPVQEKIGVWREARGNT